MEYLHHNYVKRRKIMRKMKWVFAAACLAFVLGDAEETAASRQIRRLLLRKLPGKRLPHSRGADGR